MPTYEYACDACGHKFEEFQSIKAKPTVVCPVCKKRKVKRLISAGGGFIFKGSGFYITDYRSEGYKAAAKNDASGASAASPTVSGGKSDAGPKTDGGKKEGGGVKTEAPKSEAKPAAAAPAAPSPPSKASSSAAKKSGK